MQLDFFQQQQLEQETLSHGQERPYQTTIIHDAIPNLLSGLHVLSVAATGTGKTFIASRGVSALPGRVLWIAHRLELVQQATKALTKQLGCKIGLELPGSYSSDERVVVASKDTIRTKARLERLKNFEPFRWIVTDECHHSTSKSYQVIYQTWPQAGRWGLTATPNRLDKKKLTGFNYATKPYGIVEALADNWLVPIHAKRCKIASVDLSGIELVQGDFNPKQLRALMESEQHHHAIAKSLLEAAKDRPGINFCTSVDAAREQANILNRYKPGCAQSIDGTTPKETRDRLFREFGKSYQFLCNMLVATEGTDLPAAAVISLQRPTHSPSLFVQMLGRGLRPEPGIDQAQDRKSWIAQSSKPNCLVLDYVGVTGKHSVATAADLLLGSGELPSMLSEVAARLDSGEELDISELVSSSRSKALAEQEAAKLAKQQELLAKLQASVKLSMQDTRLIGLGGELNEVELVQASKMPASAGQINELGRLGIAFKLGMTAAEAAAAIRHVREVKDLAMPGQLGFIKKFAPWMVKTGLTNREARSIIGRFKAGKLKKQPRQ